MRTHKEELIKFLKETRSDVIAFGSYLPGSETIQIFDRLIARTEHDELTDHDANLIESIVNHQAINKPESDIDLLDPETGFYIN